MLTLGRFTATADGYAGVLRTLALSVDLRFTPLKLDREKAPSHRVLAGEAECGAAWPGEGENVILNVRLDDPSWPEPMRARLVRGAGDELLLLWRRPASD
jgi:uncharacterized protein (DUF736 family)